MGDCNLIAGERASFRKDVLLVFNKVDSREKNNGGDHDECGDRGEGTAERIPLQSNCRVSCDYDQDAPETEEAQGGSENSPESNEKEKLYPPTLCVRGKPASPEENGGEGPEKPKRCPALGLFYAFLSAFMFSIISLLVKSIQGVHALEISTLRCFFQMLFIMPFLIYNKTGFLGPRDKRIYLVLRGFFGSTTMILLFYAIQRMSLADAIVIMFSNPVFTSLLAWIFLKEKCTILDCVFTVFTLTGVVLIARPPFIFGNTVYGIDGDYVNHIKGTIAVFAGAVSGGFTYVTLRKIGKSVHLYLSVWYYAVIGFIECVITVSILGEWTIPFCGRDRWMLMLIAVLGIIGQVFITKALQLEKAGPVSLIRTVEVVLAFIFQFIFFNHAPTYLSLGGALCIVASTVGVALRKWYNSIHKT
ncbi:solute carrier family 35 member G1 isoform X2 [Antennarius striatus]|uniref:solute carrier family 35 member G1 isoform X2 n=1 Tax=Antennarius striatus TaxID=241820 RepID=UPI0035ADFADD